MNDLSHRDIFGPSFFRAWNDFLDFKYSTYCFSGGRGSLKSSFVSLALIAGLERDRQEAFQHFREKDPHWRHYLTHAVCFRKVFGTCETSVYSQLVWAIDKLGLTSEYKCSKSPLKIVRKDTEQMILFRGLDDPLKSKSLKAPFSFFRYLWFEEAAEYDGIEEIRNVGQSVRRGGHQFQTFFSYNPPETSACWVNYTMHEMSLKDPTFHLYKSDYRTVPREWLGDQFFAEAELLRQMNERAYRHEYLGEITGNGGTVFPNVKEVHLTDEEISHFDHIKWGCDFGTVDPTVLLGLEYEKVNHRIIIFSEVYENNMLLDEMERRFRANYFGHEYIRADCAAKQMIMEMENRGFNMLGATKGPDSIMHGVKWIQNLREVLIDPLRCPQTYKEFTQYEYEKSPLTGEFTSRLPDKNNHAIDSCLVGDTMVHTERGLVAIGDLVGKEGRLWAWDAERGESVLARFKNVRLTRKDAAVVMVLLRNADQVTCTPDHRILTDHGYVEAGSLVAGDKVLTRSGAAEVFSVTPMQSHHFVYDLEVPVFHNFAVGNGMFVHNCRYAVEDISSGSGLF